MKRLLNYFLGIVAIAIMATQATSCKDDEPKPDVIASFNFEVDEDDYKTIHFENFSQGYTSLSWDFGDGTAESSEEDPSHTYATDGTYTVVLTATGANGEDTFEEEIVIENPEGLLDALTGETSKTWKLLRDASTGRYPLLVGPLKTDGTIDGQWWGMGRDNDEISIRACMLNHEYTFTRAGLAVERDLNGFMWGEGHGTGGQFPNENVCFSTTDPDNMKDKDDGADLSVWGDFNGTFELIPGTPNKLKINGLGAYMGIEKVGTDIEVTAPQASVTYNIEKLTDGEVDTLMVRINYKFAAGDPNPGGYWIFTFVHYDNPGDEPPIPIEKPITGFTSVLAGNQLTTTNTTTGANSYSWDFGDGSTSTAQSPVHTFANDGIYIVELTATNAGGSTSARQMVIANSTTPALTTALLQGAAWKVRADHLSLFVGPAMGSSEWFVVPKTDLVAGGSWACLSDDEFKFSAGGVYGYDTKGSVRNDGYMGGTNGCMTDAELAAVAGDGKKLKTEANHSFTFTPAAGGNRAIITVTNAGGGSTASAFLGFYKAFWGGENKTPTDPVTINNGATSIQYEVMAYAKSATKEYLFVTCDISAGKDGSASWSFVLVR